MKVQIVARTDAPQIMASITGPVEAWAPEIYISKRAYDSVHHAKTIAGTIQSRAERSGFTFHGALIIPHGMTPPANPGHYVINSPAKVQVSRVPEQDGSWEIREPYQRFFAEEGLKNPETVIIEPNEYYPEGLREIDIHMYYNTMGDLVSKYYKEHEVDGLVMMKVGKKLIVKRNASIEVLGMKIDNRDAFNSLNRGRTVEFHFAVGKKVNQMWLDLDPGDEFPWEDTKSITQELVDMANKRGDIEGLLETKIRFSGKSGFHIIFNLSNDVPTDEARAQMKKLADTFIKEKGDERLVTKTPTATQMRIDYSTLHDKGGLRVPFSMAYPTGLVCIEFGSLTDIATFEKSEATTLKVMERVDRLGKWSSELYNVPVVDTLIKKWLTGGPALTKEEVVVLLDAYHDLGLGRLSILISQVTGKEWTEDQVHNALLGQAMVHNQNLEFKARDLSEYREKRDVSKTGEPVGEDEEHEPPGLTGTSPSEYVVQQHQAKKAGLHYDLRLAQDGVLKSWAVPKLEDLMSGKKRQVLAIEVEDHPASYASFEGEIPEGYGAGTVKIVAQGEYETVSQSPDKWTFKLKGDIMGDREYNLIRTSGKHWLLQGGKK